MTFLPQTLTNLAAIFGGSASDDIALDDDGAAANGAFQMSTAGGERPLLVLTNPQALLSIDTGAGDDSLTVAAGFDSTAAAGSFRAALELAGAEGHDQVTLNAPLMLAAGEIRIHAEEIAVNAGLNSGGGNVLFDAAGAGAAITMTEPAAIDAGLGTIDLRADGDVTLTALESLAGGIAISVESRQGQIIDGGDTLADMIAPAAVVQLAADAGIGNADALDMRAGVLDAVTQSGSIRVHERDNLDIHRARILQLAGDGHIEIMADGSLTVTGAGEGVAVNNNSNVTLDAAGNLVIQNTAQADDIHLAGSGLFVGRAGAAVDLAPAAVVRTSFGHLVGLPGAADAPHLAADLGGPGINIDANNRASLEVQLPPGSGFEVIIDWNDFPQFGDPEVLAPLGGGVVRTFDHQYLLGNPTGSPTNNIPYTVRIEFAYVDADTNAIQFFSGGAPLAVQLEGEFTVPLQGIQSFAATKPPRESPRIAPPAEPVARMVETPAPPQAATVGVDFNAIVGELSTADVERVELRIVTPTGEEILVFEWSRGNIDILKNLAELFEDLPDDRYRLYLIRQDGSQQLVVDVVLRQHKPFDPLDEAEADRSRPSQYQAEPSAAETEEAPASGVDFQQSTGDPLPAEGAGESPAPHDGAARGQMIDPASGPEPQAQQASAAFGAAAWAALRARRIDQARGSAPAAKYSLTKAARTARRIVLGPRPPG